MSDKKRTLSEICEEFRPGVIARNANAFFIKREPPLCAHGLVHCTSPMCKPAPPAPQGSGEHKLLEPKPTQQGDKE